MKKNLKIKQSKDFTRTALSSGFSEIKGKILPITYSRAIQYAKLFVENDLAKDLVHDLYIHLHRQGVDLFGVSKRFVYVAMYNYHRNKTYRSIVCRNGYTFMSFKDEIKGKSSNPLELLIAQELEATLNDYLRLRVEGYTQDEIGKKLGISRRSVNKNTAKALKKLR